MGENEARLRIRFGTAVEHNETLVYIRIGCALSILPLALYTSATIRDWSEVGRRMFARKLHTREVFFFFYNHSRSKWGKEKLARVGLGRWYNIKTRRGDVTRFLVLMACTPTRPQCIRYSNWMKGGSPTKKANYLAS